MKIGIAQINSDIGDFPRNAKRIMQAYRKCVDEGADIVVTPELSLVGYPPRDLLTKPVFIEKCLQALDYLADESGDVPLIVGYVDEHELEEQGKPLRNAAAVLQSGRIKKKIWKTLLPSYDMFDEAKYFEPAESSDSFEYLGKRIGLTIGEDIWLDNYISRPIQKRNPIADLTDQGVDVLINVSASPFQRKLPLQRMSALEVVACGMRAPVVYCNAVGMNEQLVFDGSSVVLNSEGYEVARLPSFEPFVGVIDLEKDSSEQIPFPKQNEVGNVHDALVLGIRDYVQKIGFDSVALILDGGIESALVAVLAVEALGAESVKALIISDGSTDDKQRAKDCAEALGVDYKEVSIAPMTEAAASVLEDLSGEREHPRTGLGLTSRICATLLLAYARNENHLALSSANRSDLAIGLQFLGGESSAGIAVLSDVPKMIVHELARFVSSERGIIPMSQIEEQEELAQTWQLRGREMIPAYVVLDSILELYIDYQISGDTMVQQYGYDENTVRWVQRRVDLNEWKRQQAAPSIQVTSKAFGMCRRMPTVQSFVD